MASPDDAHVSPESRIGFAIVLAGGTGRRMGGASKPDVVVAGRRMIDHVLDELAEQKVPAVVVGPPDLDVPGAAALVREDPPLGGPAAGIAAGYAAGAGTFEGKLVAVLACDAPFAPRVLPRLAAAAGGPATAAAAHPPATTAGAVAVTPDGRVQRLLCVIGTAALGAAIERLESDGGVRDRSVRALLGDLHLAPVDVPSWAMDADSPDDVAELERLAEEAVTAGRRQAEG